MATKELIAFLAWAEENEIVWDRDAIDIRDGKNGLGVFAKRKLEAGYEGKKKKCLADFAPRGLT